MRRVVWRVVRRVERHLGRHVAHAVAPLGAGLAAALLVACGGGGEPSVPTGPGTPTTPTTPTGPPPAPTPTGPVGPFTVGVPVVDTRAWMEYVPGDAPLVLIAPHGGTLLPSQLPDRSCSGCVTVNDANTQELARAIADAFARRTGARPHLVVNRLHRRKFDGNRAIIEATGGTSMLEASWFWFHEAVDTARADVVRRHQRGLVLDLHGHAHGVARLELGYLLTAGELRASDSALSADNAMARSSIARLAADARAGERGTALLRGAEALGTQLHAAGYPSVPSAQDPAPLAGQDYFTGGYNTVRHGSIGGGALDAIQVESHFAGVRDSEASRAAFAEVLARELARFLERHYGWRGPGAP
jgi:hypothetical protein